MQYIIIWIILLPLLFYDTLTAPPSIPRISPLPIASARQLYPFLAGTSGILKCHSEDSVHSGSIYTWLETGGGLVNGSYLSFEVLTRQHDGRTVSCRVWNAFTTIRQPVVDAIFKLEVYYAPDVSIIPVMSENSNQCLMNTPDMRHCVVSEGEHIHFRCHATSNPSPESVTWALENHTDSSDPDTLLIVSADRARHNKTFMCIVTTAILHNDTRLPLRSFYNLTVTVKYPPRVLDFTTNRQENNKSMIIRENECVSFYCQADGRPVPQTWIIKPDNSTLREIPLGGIVPDDGNVEVDVCLPGVSCDDSGAYVCAVKNGFGEEHRKVIHLIVHCKPKNVRVLFPDVQDGIYPLIVDRVPNHLILSLTSNPVPTLKSVLYIGERYNDTVTGHLANEDVINAVCTTGTENASSVACNITVQNVSSTHNGFYSLMLGNELGNVSVIIEIRLNCDVFYGDVCTFLVLFLCFVVLL